MKPAGWDAPGGYMSMSTAARYLGVSLDVVQEVVRRGFVQGERVKKGNRIAVYASWEEWREGWRSYRAQRTRPGMVGAEEASRKLGVSPKVLQKARAEGFIRAERVPIGRRYFYFAPLEVWREGYEAYRQAHPQVRGAERKKRKGVEVRLTRRVMPQEVVEQRMRELAEKREAFRAFVMAVVKGLPLPERFVPIESEDNKLLEVV